MSWQGTSVFLLPPSQRGRVATWVNKQNIPTWDIITRGWQKCWRFFLFFTAYVDDHLVATGKVKKAAILGKQGGVWAASPGYNVSASLTIALLPRNPQTCWAWRWLNWLDLLLYSFPSKNRTPLLRHIFSNPTVSEVSSISLFLLFQMSQCSYVLSQPTASPLTVSSLCVSRQPLRKLSVVRV